MNSTASILIVEDELIIAETIMAILENGGYEHFWHVENVDEAIAILERESITMVITDIALGIGKSGIELGELIRVKYKIPFIYITSYASAEIISKAKPTHPAGYIVKPFKKDDILVALELALFNAEITGVQEAVRGELVVKEGRSLVRVYHDTIKWISADGNYTTIYLTNQKRLVIRQTLMTLEAMLPQSDFIRIHKSYIVYKGAIDKVKSDAVVIGNNELPVGRSYQQKVAVVFR